MPGRLVVTRALCLLGHLAFLLFLQTGPRAAAQDLRYLRHGSWSTENGLPQNSVHQILQTKDGFLWIATEGGVARFDGVSFNTFNHVVEPAFASDDACCLVEGSSGDLWIGTSDGLLRLRGGVFRRFSQKDGLPSTAVLRLQLTSDARLLVQTDAGAVVQSGDRFDPDYAKAASDLEGSRASVKTQQGNVWDMSNKMVKLSAPGFNHAWKASTDLPGSRVQSLFVDQQGNAWVSTNDGLVVINALSHEARSIPALRGNSVLQTYEDREGNYWIGTETTGLHLLHAEPFHEEPGLADQTLTAVIQASDGDIWIGTRNDGLRRLRRDRIENPIPSGALTSPVILSLAPGRNGDVWAGTPDGLNHIDARGKVLRVTSSNELPDDYIRALAAVPDGTIWIGTRRGLVRLKGNSTRVFTHADGLGSDLIGALLAGSNGDLWAGTSGGLSRLTADGSVVTYRTKDGLPSLLVSALAEGPAGTIWIASGDGRISRLRGSQIETVQGSGLQPGNALALLTDRAGYLWISSERSLQRVSVADLNGCLSHGKQCVLRVSSYSTADGMPSSEFVAGGSPLLWQMADGEIWSATKKGAAIAAAQPSFASEPFPLVIERVLVDGSEQNLQHGPVGLAAGDTRIDIEYAGLSLATPLQVTYRYKLEGFDRDWTTVGNRRMATYTNLPARNYRFRVQALGRDGAGLGAEARLPFVVTPPVYRRWWFIVLAALLVAAAAVLLYRFRLRTLRKRFDAVLRERNRLAREIHDTLAQDFVGVALQLDLVSQFLASGKADAATQQVRSTRKLVMDGLADARRSIWELRASTSEHSLPTRLAALVERYSGPSLRIDLQVGGAYRQIDARVEEAFLRVAQEALSNVQRHSGAADAMVQLRFGTDMLVMVVKDQGQGFVVGERAMTQGHFGVSGMHERATALGATLLIASEPGLGTTLTLRAKITGEVKS